MIQRESEGAATAVSRRSRNRCQSRCGFHRSVKEVIDTMARESEIEGTIQQILERKSAKGESYRVIRVAGEGYFDWTGVAEEVGVKEGDTVKLKVNGGEFPRIRSIEKSGNAEEDSAQNSDQSTDDAPETDGQIRPKDVLIVRMSCLRSATELLASLDADAEAKQQKVLTVAEAMTKWVSEGGAA